MIEGVRFYCERLLSFRRASERNLLFEESIAVKRRDWLVLQ